jgi:integrase/recombinase XerD
MSTQRTFPTTAAVRYDRALRRGLQLNPLPPECPVPRPTSAWPPENVDLLERYRDWLVAIGASTSVISQHRIPMAGHVLGLTLKPHPQLDLVADFEKALAFVRAKRKSALWERNCGHSLTWFRRFVKVERGLVIRDDSSYGDVHRYQADLPPWLVTQLTRLLHIRQANWRPSRMAQSTYRFWFQSTRLWRWLFAETGVRQPEEVTREHLFRYIDAQLVAGYQVATINLDLQTFQGTLRFLHQQGLAIPHQLLTLPGLKKPQRLPRFLTDAQVVALRDDLRQRVTQARTPAAVRHSRLDLAAFTLLWQTGIRVSELEDLRLGDVDLAGGALVIREAKGLKDRAVFLTARVVEALRAYLEVRGPALSDHLFIYRHKPLSKDFMRSRLRGAGKRLGFKVTPHMLRHTFATQLVNAGADVTTIQALLGHKRLNTTMSYARVHDRTVMDDYFRAMAQIEGEQTAVLAPSPDMDAVRTLLDELGQESLSDGQQELVDSIRRLLGQEEPAS